VNPCKLRLQSPTSTMASSSGGSSLRQLHQCRSGAPSRTCQFVLAGGRRPLCSTACCKRPLSKKRWRVRRRARIFSSAAGSGPAATPKRFRSSSSTTVPAEEPAGDRGRGAPELRRDPAADHRRFGQRPGPIGALAGPGTEMEVKAAAVEIIGTADATYPLQKKGHTPEFLREIAHLRPRSNLFGCVFRVRSRLAFAVHHSFRNGVSRMSTRRSSPAATAKAPVSCSASHPRSEEPAPAGGRRNRLRQGFFRRPTYLTVSGQLEAEAFACALSKVYTFGPTFRAENSNTSRHASEFWMIEPEMAFCDLRGNMGLAEEFVKYLIRDVRNALREDLELFAKFVDKGLLERLDFVLDRPFQRVSYTEAVELLTQSGHKFEYPVEYGTNSSRNTSAI